MSTITREQAKDLRNAFECWQQDYDPAADKEQYEMFGLGVVAMDVLLASLDAGSNSNSHPAHGPLSNDRLHRIREILGKAAAQSDGGNVGYAMSDAVKAFDEVLERRKADSAEVIYQYRIRNGYNGQVTEWQTIRRDQVDFVLKAQPLNAEFQIIAAPQPAPVFPDEMAISDDMNLYQKSFAQGHNACRAAIIQHGGE
ncbi:hypothetical protein [Citrobacter koseri]|uniref:hypothetical protein n=1 Tax=Citrobacter koseri TaxID=545 RepID=UPI0023B0629C|nr:hypothetical protein [Citrobacter koseri]